VTYIPRRISEAWAHQFETAAEAWSTKRRELGYNDLPPTVASPHKPPTPAERDALDAAAARRDASDIGETMWTAYIVGIWITRVIIFVGCWVYCVATYGFLLGVGLG
jgi:hypothetical protein